MRCRACDALLSDLESTRRSASSGDYSDLCGPCFAWVQPYMATSENFLLHDGQFDDLTSDRPGLSGEEPHASDNFSDRDEFDPTEDRD